MVMDTWLTNMLRFHLDGGDCNDEDNTIYTGAEDVWYDGVDSIVMELMTTTKMEMATF